MMTLASVTGEILTAECKDHADAVNYLIDRRLTGNFLLAGLDEEGKFRGNFIDIGEAGNAAKGMAVVYLTEVHGKRWHFMSTPFPKAAQP